MTDNLEVLLQLLFETLTVVLHNERLNSDYMRFLEAIGKELPDEISFDMLHNKYFNYISQDHPTTFSPSRFYEFRSLNPITNSDDIIKQISKADWQNVKAAECAMSIGDVASALATLRILQKILEHQVVLTVYFVDKASRNYDYHEMHEITELMLRCFRLSKHARVMALGHYQMLLPAFTHVIQELNGCDRLRYLCLFRNTALIPVQFSAHEHSNWMKGIGNALATMKSLRNISLRGTFNTSEVGHEVMSGLCHCRLLKSMDLRETNLTGCLEDFLGGDHKRQFPSLENINFRNTKLGPDDIKCIFQALQDNRLPSVKQLDLSSNTLTNCLGILTEYSRLPCLEELNLLRTELSRSDFKDISRALYGNKLPSLKYLNLGYNTLTGCMKHMLDEEFLGPCSLGTLDLARTYLNKKDLRSLLQALNIKQMSECRSLILAGNILTGYIKELFGNTGFLFVEYLDFEDTSLNREDLLKLLDAIQNDRLPKLAWLSLSLQGVENTIEHFLETCIKCCGQRNKRLGICLHLNDASTGPEFTDKLSTLCKGTNVSFGTLYYGDSHTDI